VWVALGKDIWLLEPVNEIAGEKFGEKDIAAQVHACVCAMTKERDGDVVGEEKL